MTERSSFEEVGRLFRSIFAAETKKEQSSENLRRFTIDDYRDGNEGHAQSALEALLERITMPIPMAKDRDEESLISFLKEAFNGTDWGMGTTTRLSSGHSYQELLNSLKISPIEVKIEEEVKKADKHTGAALRESLWRTKGDNVGSSEAHTTHDTLFAG